jgi:hypothetical protein
MTSTPHTSSGLLEATSPPTLRVLLTYDEGAAVAIDQTLEDLPARVEVFAAAGVAAADRHGSRVPLDGYAAWLQRHQDRLTAYANLDVADDPDATWEHQQALEAVGLHPLPVVHLGEDHQVLRRYLDAGYRYVGLGTSSGVRTRDLDTALPWLRRCFELATGRAGLHLFGANSWAALVALPWYSADISTWAAGLPQPAPVFDPECGCFHLPASASGVERGFAATLRNPATTAALAARAWQMAEGWLADRYGPVIITGRDPLGPRLYLAGSLGALQLAWRGLAELTAAGEATDDAYPPLPASDAGELPPVIVALDARQRAWVRGALDFLDAHGVELVAGDVVCGGFPEGRPWANMLGALLLYNHGGWLPTNRGQQRYLSWRAWGLGAQLALGIRERAAAPYLRAWDAIISAGGSQAIRRLLDTADAADAAGPA